MAAYTGTPRTWAAAEKVTATLLNSDLRDPLAALMGAPTAFTPTVGGTGWTKGNGTTSGNYKQAGKLVIAQASFVYGSTSTYGGAGVLSLSTPVTGSGTIWAQYVWLYDNGSNSYTGNTVGFTNSVAIYGISSTKGSYALPADTFIPTTGDSWGYSVIYEAA